MTAKQTISDGQPKRKEWRVRLRQSIRQLQNELHWDMYFSRYPEAARMARQKVERIIDEELREHEARQELAHV